MKKTTLLILKSFALVFLAGCDPYYSITVTNHTSDTATMMVMETNNFLTEKAKHGVSEQGLSIYKLAPGEKMEIGNAIGGLDDDMPFSRIKIIYARDTITGSTLEENKDLFDENMFGGIETPYNISIE